MTLDSPQPTPFPLGRLINHDPRSRNFPAPRSLLTMSPIIHRRYGRVLNQGSLGSCTGNALVQAKNMQRLRKKGERLYTQTDAVAIYAAATAIDPWEGTYPPEDTGSDGLSVAKVAHSMGYISGYSHCFGIQHAREALRKVPLLVGTVWMSQMFYPDDRGFVHPQGFAEGGHEYVLMGDNPQREELTFLNSWGPEWGSHGRFKMSYESFDYLLRQHGDVVALVPTP